MDKNDEEAAGAAQIPPPPPPPEPPPTDGAPGEQRKGPPEPNAYGGSAEFEARGFESEDRDWMPTAETMAQLSALFERSTIVGVCSRFQPGQIAFRSLPEALSAAGTWTHYKVSPRGALVSGDVEPLIQHLAEGRRNGIYRLSIDSSLGAERPALLLLKLADKTVFQRLSDALAEQSSVLLLLIQHVGTSHLQFLDPGFKEFCHVQEGWIANVSWLREWPQYWAKSATVLAASQAPHAFLDTVRDSLADPEHERQGREHRLFMALDRFDHSHIRTPLSGIGPKELVGEFEKILAGLARDDDDQQTWIGKMEALLALPPPEKTLEKLMLTIAACQHREQGIPYQAFRHVGAMALHGRSLIEDATLESQELRVGKKPSQFTYRREPKAVHAGEAWLERFDHLARAVELQFRIEDGQRLVVFPDRNRKASLGERLTRSYPSLVDDLCNRLVDMDVLFHPDGELRRCAASILVGQCHDLAALKKLMKDVLAVADALIRDGPRDGSPLAGLPASIFTETRQHTFCVQELFAMIARQPHAGILPAMRRLLDDAGWQYLAKFAVGPMLMRVEVLMSLPSLGGLHELARRIDAMPPEAFPPLRDAMLGWPRDGSDKSTLLILLGAWMPPPERKTANLQRSEMLAQEVWIATMLGEVNRPPQLDAGDPSRPIGEQMLLNPARADEVLPWLMRVRWRELRFGGAGINALRYTFASMLLSPPEETATEQAFERQRKKLLEVAAGAIVKPGADATDGSLSAEDREEIDLKLAIAAYAAGQASRGDPKTFDDNLQRLLQKQTEDDPRLGAHINNLAAAVDRLLWPLDLTSGLIVLHWCFRLTGVDERADDVRREGSDKTNRELLAAFLDAIVHSLNDAASGAGVAEILRQWKLLGTLWKRLSYRIDQLRPDQMDPADRRLIVAVLGDKQDKLKMLMTALEALE